MADIKHYKEEKERYRKFYMAMIDRGVIDDPFDDISYDEYLFDEFYQTLCGGECSNEDSGLHLQRVSFSEAEVCEHPIELRHTDHEGVTTCKKCGLVVSQT